MTNKERLLTKIAEEDPNRNRMGCNESWYDADYAIQHTFTKEEIELMSDKEVDDLLKLAETLSGALY